MSLGTPENSAIQKLSIIIIIIGITKSGRVWRKVPESDTRSESAGLSALPTHNLSGSGDSSVVRAPDSW